MSKVNSCCSSSECCDEPAVTTASTKLVLSDHICALKSRLGIGRIDYAVEQGLYTVGKPDNYYSTYD